MRGGGVRALQVVPLGSRVVGRSPGVVSALFHPCAGVGNLRRDVFNPPAARTRDPILQVRPRNLPVRYRHRELATREVAEL